METGKHGEFRLSNLTEELFELKPLKNFVLFLIEWVKT